MSYADTDWPWMPDSNTTLVRFSHTVGNQLQNNRIPCSKYIVLVRLISRCGETRQKSGERRDATMPLERREPGVVEREGRTHLSQRLLDTQRQSPSQRLFDNKRQSQSQRLFDNKRQSLPGSSTLSTTRVSP
eukprot:3675679-Rhodomonas_salina.1